MGNDLDGITEILALPFLADDRMVYLARGYIVIASQVGVREPFIMPEIEIGFSPVPYFPWSGNSMARSSHSSLYFIFPLPNKKALSKPSSLKKGFFAFYLTSLSVTR